MMRMVRFVMVGIAIVGVSQFAGCRGFGQFPVTVDLGANGTFEVVAGTPSENPFAYSLDTGGITVGSGTLRLNPDAITVTPEGTSGKGTADFQITQALTVMVWVDEAANVETVCGSEDEYGPYTVSLDENYDVVAITPNSVTLSQNTLDLLNLGQFSVCIRVESPVTGRVEIDSMTFTLGL